LVMFQENILIRSGMSLKMHAITILINYIKRWQSTKC